MTQMEKKAYVEPTLEKREELIEVAEGDMVIISGVDR